MNYANVDVIVDVAVKHGVDAVWPGWGHASGECARQSANEWGKK